MNFQSVDQIVIGLLSTTAFMTVLWLIQWQTRDAGIVDVGWSASLGLLALFYGLTQADLSSRTMLVMGIASLWSFRLATYLLRDRILGKPEDGRYKEIRSRQGRRVQIWFFGFFQLQAVVAWIFSLAFLIAMQKKGSLDYWDGLGLSIWMISVFGESIADRQLARFRNDSINKGKVCQNGLWRYSRHPNYFFEWMHWWSYLVIGWQSSFGWVNLFAPALMLFFLFKVTGIPATESHALISRGDEYRDYQRTTSMFIPWFPKRAS